MMEALYALILIVFGALITAALAGYGLKASALREEEIQLRERLERENGRLATVRAELDTLELDIELLELEKESLQAQEECMRALDRFDAGAAVERSEDPERPAND